MIEHLAIAITFFYREDRLPLLKCMADQFVHYAKQIDLFVITNTDSLEEQASVMACFAMKGLATQLKVPQLLGHPYLLAWSHLAVFRGLFQATPRHSHFLYLEDDLLVRPECISYWLESRELLRPFNLIPGFIRYEIRPSDQTWVAGDVTQRLNFHALPKVQHEGRVFCNLPFPYQAMYLLDRALMQEHLASPSSNPDFGRWNIREKAAQGLTFWGVPKGFHSRIMLGLEAGRKALDRRCLVHHMPNNGANDPQSRFGKIPLDAIFL